MMELYPFSKWMAERIRLVWCIENPDPFHGFIHMADNLIVLDILPKLVFTGQDVPGPQNSLLRCRTVLILYNDRSRLGGVSFCGLLFKGKNNPTPNIIVMIILMPPTRFNIWPFITFLGKTIAIGL